MSFLYLTNAKMRSRNALSSSGKLSSSDYFILNCFSNLFSKLWTVNSGERIPRRLCRGVSKQRNKEVLDGIACPTVRRGFPAALRRGVSISRCFFLIGTRMALILQIKNGYYDVSLSRSLSLSPRYLRKCKKQRTENRVGFFYYQYFIPPGYSSYFAVHNQGTMGRFRNEL